MEGNVREIVNGAQLKGFNGKKASDNQIVKINLKRPLDKPLEGYVEVHGTSAGKEVIADDFVIFTNDKFDAKGHNALCQFLYSVPNLWKIS